jgi:hypothetical protein
VKAPLRGKIKYAPVGLSDEIKERLLKETEPLYWQIALARPMRQEGQDFHWLVVPIKMTPDMKGEQSGAGVLCQTEAEAKETFESLKDRGKKYLVAVQTAGFGIVGWATHPRHTCNEIVIVRRKSADGKKLWVAVDQERDLDTLEAKVLRSKETESEGEAEFWKGKWIEEYKKEKKAHFEAIAKSVTPKPPPRCTALTKLEMEDLGKAKMKALQRQWPRCFEIFEKHRSSPGTKIPDHECEDAYLVDLVANGGDQLLETVEGGKIRADMQLILALQKAAKNYTRRGKTKITDAAIYLIAFNWELGWCYLSNEELAEKITEILEMPFTAEQVEKYRYRTLGLVAKHKPGAETNVP